MKIFIPVFLSVCIVFVGAFGINCLYGYLFPVRYKEEILSASTELGLDAALVFSVINVESHFRENAISAKGAVGLMQVLPSTAEEVAKNFSWENFDLKEPETNIKIGAYYLSQLLHNFGSLDVALAAYNAGPTNVGKWLKNNRLSEDGKTLKEITFRETREYVKKVKKCLKIYSRKQFIAKE